MKYKVEYYTIKTVFVEAKSASEAIAKSGIKKANWNPDLSNSNIDTRKADTGSDFIWSVTPLPNAGGPNSPVGGSPGTPTIKKQVVLDLIAEAA